MLAKDTKAEKGPLDDAADTPKAASGVGKGPTDAHARIEILGVPIDNVTLDEALRRIEERVLWERPGYIVTPNVDHICRWQRDARFREVYSKAFLSLADGMPVLWAGRLLGKRIRAKLSGSDMIFHVSELAARRGYSIFLLGAAEGVAAKAAERLRQTYPGLRIVGVHSPPYGFEKDIYRGLGIVRMLRAAQPDICFVALGAPKQEHWMRRFSKASGVPVMMGVGASLDFVSGQVKRAPRWMQRAGLEWLWRLCAEPRRLWKRYLVDDSLFFLLLAQAMLRRRRPSAARG